MISPVSRAGNRVRARRGLGAGQAHAEARSTAVRGGDEHRRECIDLAKRIVIIQGHPDPAGHHLLHALADAYGEGAAAARHDVRRIDVAKLEFPLLRTQTDFETGLLPPALARSQEDMRWAEHWVVLFPLWHGSMPALFKGFLEHVFRPGFAMEYKKTGFPKRLLAGRSARIVVTMGMPVLLYRWYFGAYGLRGFERSVLSFAGIRPIRESLYGLTFADEKKRAGWIAEMRRHGTRAA